MTESLALLLFLIVLVGGIYVTDWLARWQDNRHFKNRKDTRGD